MPSLSVVIPPAGLLGLLLISSCTGGGPSDAPPNDAGDNGAEGEGEGEQPAEGEGEGEQPVEGEGEQPAEGEGEQPAEGEGEACARAPLCGDVTPSASLLLAGNGVSEPSVTVDGGAPITVAQTTRATVESLLGTGTSDGDNAFRQAYCAAGLLVQYVDSDGDFDAASSNGAATDRVARILTLPGARASMTGEYTVGMPAPALASDEVAHPAAEGTIRFAPTRGTEAILDANGAVAGLVLYRTQDSDRWALPLGLRSGSQSVGALDVARAGGSTFNQADTILGRDWDAEGDLEVDGIRIRVRVYAALGLRLAGVCKFSISAGWNCNDPSSAVQTVTISAPYLGRDDALGIGSMRSDFEAVLGASDGTDDNGVTTYGGDGGLGVIYVEDSACNARAAALVLGYSPP